jgi:DNA transformation protein
MARDHSFKDYVLDNLAGLGSVRSRGMFGGHGLYLDDRFFGIIYRGRLYFRTDENSRADYVARGMEHFRPRARQTLDSYYEVPEEIVDDPDDLTAWARRAAATRRAAGRPRRTAAARRPGRSPARKERGHSGS